jgi:putative transposase
MQTSRCTDRQIIAVLKEAEAGTPVPALCRTHGISNATFYQVAVDVRRDGRVAHVAHEGARG